MMTRADRGLLAEWWWTIDRTLLVAFLALISIGMIMSFAASPSVAERIGLDAFYFTRRHGVFALGAVLLLIATSYLTPKLVRRLALLMLMGSIVMTIVVLAAGVEVKGSRRWVSVLGISIQPSEFLKPGFVIICAWLFAEGRRHKEVPGNLLASVLVMVVCVLLLAQPDVGQTMLVTAVWGLMFFMAGMSWFWVILLGALGSAGLAGAYYTLDHVTQRINRFLTGEGDNFQVDTATEAIVSGGWLGRGPGEGTVKDVLPDSHTDFVFAVIAEEFGIVLCFVLVLLFAFVVMRGLHHALRERDDFTRLAVSGLAMLFALQAIINMGVNLKLLPAKGMTLPFISSGGSSMLAMAIGMGMLLALSRRRPDHLAKRRMAENFRPLDVSFSQERGGVI